MEVLSLISVPWWLLTVVLFLLSLCLYTVWCQSVWRKSGVPGPRPFPFLGIMTHYFTKGIIGTDMMLHQKYGRVVGAYQGNHPILLVTDPEMIKQITVKEFSAFPNRYIMKTQYGNHSNINYVTLSELTVIEVGDVLRESLVNVGGDTWKFLRSTLSPTFSTGKLKVMTPLIQNCVNNLLENIEPRSEEEKSLEMKGLFGGYTMDVIASTAFGLEINCQKNKDDPFVKYAKVLFSGTFSNPLVLIVCIFPWVNHILRLLNVSFLPKAVEIFFKDVTTSAIEMRREEKTVHRDFLQLALTANKERSDSKNERGLTDKEIYANALIFMVAGYDTTANTLTFAAYCLATNPDVQERLIKEIDKELADKPMDYDNIMSLEYLDMFLSEVLRLYAPTTRFNRSPNKDVVINGVYIPKGVEVAFPQYVLHRDPEFWTEPEKFDPERFTKENKEKRNPYCYLPFGSGPRNCIGMRLALFEAKVAIVAILQKFRCLTTPETEIPPTLTKGAFVKPENEMYLRFKRR